MLGDEASGVTHEPPEGAQPLLGLEVEADAHVDAPLAEVPEGDAAQLVERQEVVEFAQVVGEILGRDGGILPVGPGLAAVGQPGDDARRRLPDPPQRAHLVRIRHHPLIDAVPDPRRARRRLLGRRPRDLAEQPPASVGAGQVGVGAQRVDEVAAHALHRRDPRVSAQLRTRRGGVEDRVEGQHGQGLRRGELDQADRGLRDDPQRALRPRDRPHRVGRQVVQPVPGGLPGEMAQLIVDERAVLLRQPPERGVDHRVVAPVLVEGDQAAVGKHHRHGDEVVGGGAVRDGMRAARVVRDHPADRRAGVRRRIRAEGQPVLRDGRPQVIADHPRFHRGGAAFRVDRQDAVEMAGGVDDEPLTDGVARHRRSPAAGHDGPPHRAGVVDGNADVVGARWLGDRRRDAPEDGGVGTVRGAGHHVGAEAHGSIVPGPVGAVGCETRRSNSVPRSTTGR